MSQLWAESLCPLVAKMGVAASPVQRPLCLPGSGKGGGTALSVRGPGGNHAWESQAKGRQEAGSSAQGSQKQNWESEALAWPLVVILRSHFPSLGLSLLVWRVGRLNTDLMRLRPRLRPGRGRSSAGPQALTEV